MVMIGIDRAQIKGRRETADAGVDAAGHEARAVYGGTYMAQAHHVAKLVHQDREQIHTARSWPVWICQELMAYG